MGSPQREQFGVRYALAQLARALRALRGRTAARGSESRRDVDPADPAAARVTRWRAVLDGILRGELTPGSRAPIAGVPVWATPEIAHGGFATGRLLAEGPVPEGPPPTDSGGATDQGRWNRAYLVRDAWSGSFDLPEAAALPTVRALAARGHVDDARALLEVLLPWFERLRLYPLPGDDSAHIAPHDADAVVRRRTARQVADSLNLVSPRPEIELMRLTLTSGAALVDGFAALFLTTLEGEAPRRVAGVTVGGWPCARFPAAFDAEARHLLERYEEDEPHFSQRLRDSDSSLSRFVAHTRECLQRHVLGGPREATRARIRHTLANVITRRGVPGSDAHRALRTAQAVNAAAPRRSDLAHILAARLAAVPDGLGIASPEPFVHAVTEAEAAAPRVPPHRAGTPIPEPYLARLRLCREGTIDELVRAGVLTSAEALAEVLPELTAHVEASSFEDPELGALYGALYAAFRRRRTLLLLDYAQQIRLGELPWAAALERHRGYVPSDEIRRRVYVTVSRLALEHFPHTPPPNPLTTELRRLALQRVPWVPEIAADIFMGGFVRVFGQAAACTRELLAGTLYARYYDVPAELPGSPPGEDTHLDDVFRLECERRALASRPLGAPSARNSHVAERGTVLEQASILTTQNLAAWVLDAGLADSLPHLALARRCLAAALEGFAPSTGDRRADLRRTKTAAAAWRHMLFWLSLAPDGAVEAILADARAAREALEPALASRLELAMGGLTAVARGQRFDATGVVTGGRRFLGWSVGPHWALDR